MFTHKTTRLSSIYTADWLPPPQTVANRFAGGNFALSSVRVVYILIKISNRRPRRAPIVCVCVCVVFYTTVFFSSLFFFCVFFSSRFCLRCCVGDRMYIIRIVVVAYDQRAHDGIVYSGVTDQVIVRPRNVMGFQQVIVFPGS